jgi:predicted transcriptional regulator
MSSVDEQILRAAKEIVVKFIETGRISPTTFPETFKSVYAAVNETVKELAPPAENDPKSPSKK